MDHSQKRIFSEGPAVCHNLIFDLLTAYTGASLILEKLFSRSNFYYKAYVSIITSGPHFDATIREYFEFPVLMLLYSIVDHLYGCFSCFRGPFQ